MSQIFADVIITAFVSSAAWWDLTTTRIPNWLTMAGVTAALLLRAPFGLESLVRGLEGLALALAIGLVPYALRAIGGGDVKLLAGVGAFLGLRAVPSSLALIAVIGAAFALIVALRRRVLPLLLFNSLELVKSWSRVGRSGVPRSAPPGGLAVPYGVAIALGTLISWFGWGVQL
jgi:prepilin peptidase CpaA